MPWIVRITVTILPLILVAYVYIGWKFYHTAIHFFDWPKTQLKAYLLAAITYLNLHPLLLLLVHAVGWQSLARSAREGNRIWDFLFCYPFWIGLLIAVELLPWFLAMDIVKLPFFPFYKRFKTTWLDIQFKVVLTLFVVFSLYTFFRVVFDTTHIRVSKFKLTYRNLPHSMNGLKIVHISDVQADSRTGQMRLMRYAKKINALQPDLVFFTGDLVTSGTKYIDAGAKAMARVEAKYGVYGCLGDHDYWSDVPRIVAGLENNGMQILEDANRFVRVGNDSLLVTFVTNVYRQRPSLDTLNYLMGQQPRGVLDILVSHQPSENLIELAAERGYHLFLAGHTHGGQMVFKPFGMTISPAQFESPFYRGTYHVGRMFVSVNNGLGLTLAPVRYRAPAEITLIEILRQE
jgi:predicted MPP superfamily phosphohydrolase